MIYTKKAKPRKPRKPYLVLALLVLLSAGSLVLAHPSKGDLALGLGYAATCTVDNCETVRDDGYAASVEYWLGQRASVLVEADKLQLGNIYEVSLAPQFGSLFIPVGVSYFDPDDADSEYGAHLGLGINFRAEKFLGLQFQAHYHFLFDEIAEEDQFLTATGTLRIHF